MKGQKNAVNRLWKRYKVEDLSINVHTSSSYRIGILITTPSFIFLTTHINNIQQILWILLFSGRSYICKFYRSKQFWTPKLVDQKKLNVKLYLWTHVQFLVQHVLSRLYRNIVHTCWWKTQKGYCGKKNCEYLRYLQSWKYCDLN